MDVHVSTTRRIRSRPGTVVHRVRRLERVDVRPAGLLRVTRVPQTVIDLADIAEFTAHRLLEADEAHTSPSSNAAS